MQRNTQRSQVSQSLNTAGNPANIARNGQVSQGYVPMQPQIQARPVHGTNLKIPGMKHVPQSSEKHMPRSGIGEGPQNPTAGYSTERFSSDVLASQVGDPRLTENTAKPIMQTIHSEKQLSSSTSSRNMQNEMLHKMGHLEIGTSSSSSIPNNAMDKSSGKAQKIQQPLRMPVGPLQTMRPGGGQFPPQRGPPRTIPPSATVQNSSPAKSGPKPSIPHGKTNQAYIIEPGNPSLQGNANQKVTPFTLQTQGNRNQSTQSAQSPSVRGVQGPTSYDRPSYNNNQPAAQFAHHSRGSGIGLNNSHPIGTKQPPNSRGPPKASELRNPPQSLYQQQSVAQRMAANPPNTLQPQAHSTGMPPNSRVRGHSATSRIDPDQMPRPKLNSEVKKFSTRGIFMEGAGGIPSTLEQFVAYDDGNSNPRFLRSTMGQVPKTHALLKDSGIPFGLIMQPFAELRSDENHVVVVDKRQAKLDRCSRCYGYKCTFTKCDPSSGWWKCHLCSQTNGEGGKSEMNNARYDVDVFAATGELDMKQGTIEYIVSGPYAPRILRPNYVFIVDLTIHGLANGSSIQVLEAIKEGLKHLASISADARVGFVTFDSAIDFHDISDKAGTIDRKSNLVTDVDDPFCPIPPSQLLVRVSENYDKISSLLDFLQMQCEERMRNEKSNNNPGIQSIASSALIAAADGLRETGGKISFFTSSISSRGLGTLKNRENWKKYGTESEFQLLKPVSEEDMYCKLAKDCAERLISVDIYSMTNHHIDLGSLSAISNETGGKIERFPGLETGDKISAAQLRKALRRNLAGVQAIDAVMKLRVSSGLRFVKFIGPGHQPLGVQEQYLASISNDTTIAALLEHDSSDKSKLQNVYMQLAVLYTTLHGERRLRIHNLALRLSSNLTDVFRQVDVDAVTCLLARKASLAMFNKGLTEVRNSVNTSAVNMLTAYRKFCAKNPSSQQLILPEALKLLPLYVLGTMKSDLLRINPSGATVAPRESPLLPTYVRADMRVTAINAALRMPCSEWIQLIYPLMTEVSSEGLVFPVSDNPLPLLLAPTKAKISKGKIYFISNGAEMLLYITDDAPPELLEQLTGSRVLTSQASLTTVEGLEADHAKSQLLHLTKWMSAYCDIVEPLESVRVVKQNDVYDSVFARLLVEDKQDKLHRMDSYEDFLCKIHGAIKSTITK